MKVNDIHLIRHTFCMLVPNFPEDPWKSNFPALSSLHLVERLIKHIGAAHGGWKQ